MDRRAAVARRPFSPHSITLVANCLQSLLVAAGEGNVGAVATIYVPHAVVKEDCQLKREEVQQTAEVV